MIRAEFAHIGLGAFHGVNGHCDPGLRRRPSLPLQY